MTIQPQKTAFMVCSTYRPDTAPLRLYGAMRLVEEAKTTQWDQTVRLAIVDSSPAPHPFFVNPEALLADHGILYLHIPSRNDAHGWRRRHPAASDFIPDNQTLKQPVWRERHDNLKDWDKFLFFTEEFRKVYKGPQPSDFINFDRPCIGMKKNAGITALAEEFGAADYIVFCDDDDYRHPGYIGKVASALETSDFARIDRWLTLKVGPRGEDPVMGIYDIPFAKDRNNMWSVPVDFRDTLFHSTLKNADGSEFRRSVGSKFSVPLCMAWPPLGHEGALHNYRYDAWEQALSRFGGCAPTSFCEDMLMYKFCETQLDRFNVTQIETDEPLFIRCSDGTNASEVEWTRDVSADHPYPWARQMTTDTCARLATPVDHERIRMAGKNFLRTGQLDWQLALPPIQPSPAMAFLLSRQP